MPVCLNKGSNPMTGVTEAMKQDIALLLWNAPLNPSMAACLEIADRIIAMTTAALPPELLFELSDDAKARLDTLREASAASIGVPLSPVGTAAPEKEIVGRPALIAFMADMERKLLANDHKPGWQGDGLGPLTDRVLDEARELQQAVIALLRQVVWADEPAYGSRGGNGWSRRNPVTGEKQVGIGYREMDWPERGEQLQVIIDEAADVANMAMMVADEARATIERQARVPACRDHDGDCGDVADKALTRS